MSEWGVDFGGLGTVNLLAPSTSIPRLELRARGPGSPAEKIFQGLKFFDPGADPPFTCLVVQLG